VTDAEVLPRGAERDAHGAVVLGGVSVDALARMYGTPLLVLDTDVLDANVARIADAARPLGAEVAYAGKALLFVALARRLADTPLLLDVCSLGELLTAERAGFPAARLVLHGCGKTDVELAAALAGRVSRIVVDGTEELERLAAMDAPRALDVLVRVNSGVAATTHAAVRTGGNDSKFGFALDETTAAIARVRATPHLRFAGVHTHLGSQIYDAAPLLDGLAAVLDVAAAAAGGGAPAESVVVGGGFGVAARPEDADLDVAVTLAALHRACSAGCAERHMAMPRLGIEPGRAIVAAAGTSLYRVVAVKRHGLRRFVVIDGGIADNPRPALYGAYHHPLLASRRSDAPLETATVCGRSCENDELVVAQLPTDIARGDVLALCTAGGYTYSMSSNYNRFPRPAVAFAGAGRHRAVVRRQTDDELLGNDLA
jgi:diaminopimelate decarboxylase